MDIKMKLKRKRNGSFFFLFHDLTRKELKNLYVQLFLLILYIFLLFSTNILLLQNVSTNFYSNK